MLFFKNFSKNFAICAIKVGCLIFLQLSVFRESRCIFHHNLANDELQYLMKFINVPRKNC